MKTGIYKFDPKAEWHVLEDCLTDNGGQVLCMVCGEVYDVAYFELGAIITCQDCGLCLEMVSDDFRNYIVVYQPNHIAGDLAKEFYDRLKRG